jgi:DNA-binding transcriptional LysR family regulator
MPLTLEALEVIDTIARKGSFAAAAAELGRVPSALTYTVRRLEEELDVLLFDRKRRRAELTAAGRELLEEGRRLLRSADDLARRVKRVASGWEAELRIATDAMVDMGRLRPLLEEFYRQQAPTRLRFTYEVLDGSWEALLEARADLAIGAPYDAPSPALSSSQFSLRELGKVDFDFCVSPHHPLATTEPVASEAILGHLGIVVADTSRQLSRRDRGLLSGQSTLTVATLEQKIDLQAAGVGVGWLPRPHAQKAVADGRLVRLRTVEPGPSAMLHYGWRRRDPGKALQWWLERLESPRVRAGLVAGPAPSRAGGARAGRR